MATSDVGDDAGFYARLPVFDGFRAITDPATIPAVAGGLAARPDRRRGIRPSAIDEGRYKAVNIAGASVIAAVANALGGRPFPFVFGGDGASIAVAGTATRPRCARRLPRRRRGRATSSISSCARALIPVSAVRKEGFDVQRRPLRAIRRTSRTPCSPAGGSHGPTASMKAGSYAVAPARTRALRPDLSGLSCRWNDIPASRGVILSLVVAPVRHGDPAFRGSSRACWPSSRRVPTRRGRCPTGAPGVGWPPPGWSSRRAHRGARRAPLCAARLRALVETLLAYVVIRFGIRFAASIRPSTGAPSSRIPTSANTTTPCA